MSPQELTNKEVCDHLRKDIKNTANSVLALKSNLIATPTGNKDLDSEAIANAVLAYRHLEDASMRLGKVLQALAGGTSIYDATEQAINR